MSQVQRVRVENPGGDGCGINVMVGILIGLLIHIAGILSNIEGKLDARATRNRPGVPNLERDAGNDRPRVENGGSR